MEGESVRPSVGGEGRKEGERRKEKKGTFQRPPIDDDASPGVEFDADVSKDVVEVVASARGGSDKRWGGRGQGGKRRHFGGTLRKQALEVDPAQAPPPKKCAGRQMAMAMRSSDKRHN